MQIIRFALVFGLLGYTISKPLDSNDASDALVEIQKQKLIKFPEELELPDNAEGNEKHKEAKRILQEIAKINQALGYIKKQSEQSRSPAILDSSQYLFPNTGYQPFHIQSPQVAGTNGDTLLLPSIRSVKFEPLYYNKASEYNVPPTKKSESETRKTTAAQNSLYFKPQLVELAAPQSKAEEKLLPTHFVIPVRLYKQNKQQYIAKHNPQEYKIKGYKIVGDIDHFYGKAKANKTSSGNKIKSSTKYHLFFLPEEIVAKNSFKDIKAADDNSKESSSREEKLAHRPYKVQTNTQAITNGNTVNATSSSQIIKKRLVPKKGGNTNSVVSASSSTVVKVTPTTNGNGQQQHQSQQQQPQQHFQKPTANQQITQIIQPPEATPSYEVLNNQPTKPNNNNNNNQIIKNPLRPLMNLQNNNNKNNNAMKNRPLLELQNNINSINNATSNAIKTAFQNIFRLPFRPQDTSKPSTATEFTPMETMPLPTPQHVQPEQQPFYTSLNGPNSPQVPQQPLYGEDNFQNDHLDSDYRWDDENASIDNSNSDYQETLNNSHESSEPEEKNIFSNLLKHKQELQKEALKQGGIIIQKLKVRKGGIAIAGPGGVATAGSGGTAIVGPGGYALTHPRSLTIAGPGAKVIAIPSHIDLKDALQQTNLDLQTFPREGRIVATGPTVYYAPPTGDYVEI